MTSSCSRLSLEISFIRSTEKLHYLITHADIVDLGWHWFRQWLVTYSTPGHYLNQWWHIIYKTLWNQLQWNSNQNPTIFCQGNATKMSPAKLCSFCSGLTLSTILERIEIRYHGKYRLGFYGSLCEDFTIWSSMKSNLWYGTLDYWCHMKLWWHSLLTVWNIPF